MFTFDKAQPPQNGLKYLSQGNHDFGVCLSILESCKMNVSDLRAFGVPWADSNDTRFLKVTGTCASPDSKHKAIFDIQLGRVNSSGVSVELFVKMSRMNADKKMYEPFEAKLSFPD